MQIEKFLDFIIKLSCTGKMIKHVVFFKENLASYHYILDLKANLRKSSFRALSRIEQLRSIFFPDTLGTSRFVDRKF